jgi:hypothetical protein
VTEVAWFTLAHPVAAGAEDAAPEDAAAEDAA